MTAAEYGGRPQRLTFMGDITKEAIDIAADHGMSGRVRHAGIGPRIQAGKSAWNTCMESSNIRLRDQ